MIADKVVEDEEGTTIAKGVTEVNHDFITFTPRPEALRSYFVIAT
jgi:hypothetical protein